MLRPGDPLALGLATAIGATHGWTGRPLDPVQLQPLTGWDAAGRERAVGLVSREAPGAPALEAALPALEDLVEGLVSEVVGEPVDLPSPTTDLHLADLRVVRAAGRERLHQRDVEVAGLLPELAWTCALLVGVVGPSHWDDLGPDHPAVRRAALLAGVVARADDPLERARAERAFGQLLLGVLDDHGLDAAALENDRRYDAKLSPVLGLSTTGWFGRSIALRLDDANWTTRSLLKTWAHELTHHVYWSRMGLLRALYRANWPDPFRRTVEENLAEVVALLTLERLEAERLDLAGPDGADARAWLDLPLIEVLPGLDDEGRRRLDALRPRSRLVDLGHHGTLEVNAAADDVARTYRSLRERLLILARAWGASAVIDLAVDLETPSQLDALVALAEAGASAPAEVPDGD